MDDPSAQWTNPLTGHVIAAVNPDHTPMSDSHFGSQKSFTMPVSHVGSQNTLTMPVSHVGSQNTLITSPEFDSSNGYGLEFTEQDDVGYKGVTEEKLVDIVNDSIAVTIRPEEIEEAVLPPLEEMTIEQLTTTFSKKRAKYGKDAEETVTVLTQLIKVHSIGNNWSEAETYTKLFLEVTKRKLGSAHVDTLSIVRQLVDLQMKQQKHRVAAMSLKHIAKSHEELLGTTDQITLDVKNKYADCLFKHGKISEAQKLYQEILKCLIQLEADDEDLGYGLGPQKKLSILVPLIDCMVLLENHAEAEIMQGDAVALSKIVHGGEHVHTLVGIKKLAMMKEKSNKWTDAENLFKEAWGLHSTVYGARHAETLGVLLSYANLLYQLQKDNLTGKGTEGWITINELYENALSIQIEHNYGNDRVVSCFETMNRMSEIYEIVNDFSNAEIIIRKTVKVAEHLFGAKQPSTISIIFRLASLIIKQENAAATAAIGQNKSSSSSPSSSGSKNNSFSGFWEKAEERKIEALNLYHQVLNAYKNAPNYGPVHPDTLNVVIVLSDLYYQQNLPTDAVELLERAMVACERALSLGKDAHVTMNMTFETAKMYRKIGNCLQAGLLLSRIRKWQSKQMLDEGSREVLRIRGEVALVHVDMRQFNEGFQLLKVLIPLYERELGQCHIETLNMLSSMTRCYLGLLATRKDTNVNDDGLSIAAAIDMARQHMERCQATYGKFSPAGVGSTGLLSDALIQGGQSDEAVSMLTNAATACEGECGHFNVNTARMFYKLGEVHSQHFNNPGLAKTYSSRAMQIYSSIYGDHHHLTKMASSFYENIVVLEDGEDVTTTNDEGEFKNVDVTIIATL